MERVIFTSPEQEEEWNDLPDEIKAFAMKNLASMAKKMENGLAIEMLCHVINELIQRIEILEKDKI